MTTKTTHPQERAVPENEASTLALLASMADTTWRMFTPPALLVAGGIYLDLHYGTKPWMTVLGTVAGLGFSILLVRRQLKEVK